MPKKTLKQGEVAIPMAGRVGHANRELFNIYEHELERMAKVRAAKGDFAAHPPASKPLDPANFGAEDFMRRAVGGNVHHMGRGHPTTLLSYIEQGRLMAQQARWQEAEDWIRMGHEGLCNDMGPNHPTVLDVAMSLAEVLEEQYDQQLGPESPWFTDPVLKNRPAASSSAQVHGDAAVVRVELKLNRRAKADPNELVRGMLTLRRDIAMAMEEQEGPAHPQTVEAVTKFVNSLRLAGRNEAADEVQSSMEAATS